MPESTEISFPLPPPTIIENELTREENRTQFRRYLVNLAPDSEAKQQLDRIEDKLDQLLALLNPTE